MQNSLTRSAQRIAVYIQAEPSKVTQLSLAELSALTQAGEATIIRFCRTLGYKGFQDFKMDLAIEVATRPNIADSLLDADSTVAIAGKLQSAINNVLTETVNLLSLKKVEQVVKLMRPSNRIAIFGL